MAATPVTEFLLINLKTASAVEEAGTPANRALLDAISTLKQAGEGNRVFFGRQLENPSIGVIAVLRSSPSPSPSSPDQSALDANLSALDANLSALDANLSALDANLSALDANLSALDANLSALDATVARRHRTVLTPADGAAAALGGGGSTTTEVFTGYGAEAGFEERVREFAARLGGEAPAGYRGCAVGPVEVEGEGVGRGGPAVGLVVGWDSREAHLEAKGRAGAIQENIHLLRALRKEVDMWHVNFKEY